MSTNLEYEQRIAELEKEVKELKERLTVNMKREKYGLNWIDVPEAFDKESENKIPVLEEVKEKSINNDDGKPTHILIEGDNYHALQCLNYTHKGKVDVIYIDPPYNTGSDGFRYKDARFIDKYPDGSEVPKDHPLRHSYWLSFMEKRLKLAKKLLSKEGIIFISIDDNEFANLRIISDSIFGVENFLGVICWEKRTKCQNTKTARAMLQSKQEYILVYKNKSERFDFNLVFESERKYPEIDENGDSYRLEQIGEMSANGMRGRNTMIFPIEGILPKDGNQWKFGKETINNFKVRKDILIKDGKAFFRIRPEDEDAKMEPFWSLFTKEIGTAETGKTELKNIIGDHDFETVKPTALIQKLLFHASKKESIILDFFAGSGTTLQSVFQQNIKDEGSRKCIICTNNENTICEEITYPRIKNIIQGYKNSKGEQIPGLGNSLKYYKTAFIGKNNAKNATDDDRTELARRAGYLLSLGENMLDEVESNEYFQIFTDKKNATAIYFTDDYEMLDDFIEKMEEISSEYKKIIIYVFSWSTGSEIVNEFAHIRNAEIKPIPTPILEIYKSIYN